jgi:hypothetical protein
LTSANHYLVIDPENVAETICLGPLNVAIAGGLSVITFTHNRPNVCALFGKGEINNESVVRARIVTSTDNLVALRDMLNNLITHASGTGSASASSSKLN